MSAPQPPPPLDTLVASTVSRTTVQSPPLVADAAQQSSPPQRKPPSRPSRPAPAPPIVHVGGGGRGSPRRPAVPKRRPPRRPSRPAPAPQVATGESASVDSNTGGDSVGVLLEAVPGSDKYTDEGAFLTRPAEVDALVRISSRFLHCLAQLQALYIEGSSAHPSAIACCCRQGCRCFIFFYSTSGGTLHMSAQAICCTCSPLPNSLVHWSTLGSTAARVLPKKPCNAP